MRSPTDLACILAFLAVAAAPADAADLPYFSVLSEDTSAWPDILSSIGLQKQPAALAHVFVARAGTPASTDWVARVQNGAILILEGESSLAEMFGFRRGAESVRVHSLTDIHNPSLPIIWENGLELPIFELPAGAEVFARERWSRVPMSAGMKRGSGALLWIAVPPGEKGFERFPYLPQALRDLGLPAPFRSSRLWAFFDSAYRSRVDLDYFATRWRKSGIAALHVAAWHYFEPDPQNDAYLAKLIEACHREGILVYAWLELPHVSEKFWADHPEWREKTATLQDAQLDWRKLMNLSNRDCFRAASKGVEQLAGRFDWDGVNLAELYFESLEGISNPSRFTPMNLDVRAAYQSTHGFDPLALFGPHKDYASAKAFLEFRADLARRIQEEWIAELEAIRKQKPYLDLVLTHVDDRFDTGMRDAIGADAARLLPLLDTHTFTFLIEDPATVWNLGPQRYRTIAEQYAPLTRRRDQLAVDLNIVERYQDVYPTKKQTGIELFQLVHSAAANFQRVALYFENSLAPADLDLLPSSAAAVTRFERVGRKTVVNSLAGVGIPWKGGALVDGEQWPVGDGQSLWLPAGPHSIEPCTSNPPIRLLQLNAELKGAGIAGQAIEFSYTANARAIARVDRPIGYLEIDGREQKPELTGPTTFFLPRGQHVVTLRP